MSVVDMLVSPQPGQVVDLPLAKIRPSPDNPRSDVGDVTGLADSIASTGLIQPIVVYPADDDGLHEIVAGHRRYAAHRHLERDTIGALVTARPDRDADTTAARIVENVQREDLTVADEARGYAALSSLGWTQRQIADAVGVNQSHVSKRIKLADLPDPALDAIQDGSCRVEDALQLATLLDEDPQRGAETVARGHWHRVDWELRQSRAARSRQDRIAEVEAAHAAGDGPPLHPASRRADNPPLSAYDVRGVLAADHYQFRDAKVTRDQMLADGNLAVLVCRDGSTEEVCTAPKAYELEAPSTRKAKLSPFDVATERRRAFIAKAMQDTDRAPRAAHDALVDVLVDVALPSLNGAQLRDLVDTLGFDVKKSAGYRDLLGLLTELLTGDWERPSALAATACRIAEALTLCRGEERIHGDWMAPEPRHVAHLRRVEELGHELDDAETSWLAKSAAQQEDL